ncbi:MAG: hypothetical protein V4714_19445 [Bacteroidota bacterium]
MKLEELLGKRIKDVRVTTVMEFGGLDTSECVIIMENDLVTDIPFSFIELGEEIWTAEEVMDAPSIKTLLKNYQYVLDHHIADLITFEESIMFDKAFLELENGYLINEICMTNHGTGYAGLWLFKSIQEVEQQFGCKYKRLTDQLRK